jgi:hypothetical protein
VDLPDNVGEDDPQLHLHKTLCNTVHGTDFKCAMGAVDGIELVSRLDELAFGKEVLRLFPISWGSMHFGVDREDYCDSFCRAAITVVVDENDTRFSYSPAASWGE